jgi:hypothetical protein
VRVINQTHSKFSSALLMHGLGNVGSNRIVNDDIVKTLFLGTCISINLSDDVSKMESLYTKGRKRMGRWNLYFFKRVLSKILLPLLSFFVSCKGISSVLFYFQFVSC